MVDLVALLQAAQDGDGVLDVGLADEDDLETALQSGVLFDVLAIFVQRGGADGAQFAASQGRFQHVAGVNGAFGGAGADQGVQLVNEEDDLPFRFLDLLQNRLEAIFKLAAVLGAGEHGAQVQGDHALVLQNFGYVAGDDALGQAFDDGGLAHAGFTDQHRIVLGAAGEHLHDTADFLVAADHRIELAAARQLVQVLGIALQRLVFRFRILVGDALIAAHGGERLEHGIVGGAVTGEQIVSPVATLVGHGQQQMLGGDVLVLEVIRLFESLVEQALRGGGKAGLCCAAGDARQIFQNLVGLRQDCLRTGADFLQHRSNNALPVLQQRDQQVHGQQFGIAALGGDFRGALHRRLRLDG